MTEDKKGYLSNIKSFFKNKTDKLKDKFPTIFKKPGEIEEIATLNDKQQVNQKPIFTIEEDEDHKIYNYHDDDEDDYDYVEDADENIEEEKKEVEKRSPNIKPRKQSNPEVKEQQTQPSSEEEPDFEPYDTNTVCHRIYIKDTLLDLEGMSYLKCKRLKSSNKIFSMMGVNISLILV